MVSTTTLVGSPVTAGSQIMVVFNEYSFPSTSDPPSLIKVRDATSSVVGSYATDPLKSAISSSVKQILSAPPEGVI